MIAGKILTYHRASYYEDEETISLSSSTNTPIAMNGNRERNALRHNNFFKNSISCTSSRFIQSLSLLLLAALMVVGGLSWFAINANNYYTHGLQTTVAKDLGNNFNSGANNIILQQQHMMNVDVAVFEASASHVAFWEPYLDHPGASANKVLVENSMAVMSQCFGRSIFNLHMDETGTYQLQPIETMHPPQLRRHDSSSTTIQTSPSINIPMAVFTPNFNQAAMEMVDHVHQGAFITIFHDPLDIYLEQYTINKVFHDSENNDNLLVRQLSGIGDGSRGVNDADYDVAKQVLRSKFVIGSCDHPTETLRRLMEMIGNTGSIIGSEQCTKERQSWNQECRKMKEIGQQNKDDRNNLKILRNIKSKHHYDILLYEESKNLIREQHILFE